VYITVHTQLMPVRCASKACLWLQIIIRLSNVHQYNNSEIVSFRNHIQVWTKNVRLSHTEGGSTRHALTWRRALHINVCLPLAKHFKFQLHWSIILMKRLMSASPNGISSSSSPSCFCNNFISSATENETVLWKVKLRNARNKLVGRSHKWRPTRVVTGA